MFNTIEEAISDIKAGKVIIVVDDEDRENEGDISASDRSKTVRALINLSTNPDELGRPGYIFLLIEKKGSVLRRAGHTEATVDLAEMASLAPAGLLVEMTRFGINVNPHAIPGPLN